MADPRGQLVALPDEYNEELLIAGFGLDISDEAGATWPVCRNRCPKTYHKLIEL